ncbi:MAG TPA: rhodanese-like domain-containing protein [Gammaproteobacteria bacterium]|nr:rhodanese-like domain-containing protein [Gammaproteobacteria bacterium]
MPNNTNRYATLFALVALTFLLAGGPAPAVHAADAHAQSRPAASSEFPGRKLFPTTPVIELEDFHAERDKVIVVDARSHYEYEVLHIKGAINIPVASRDFVARMQELRAKDKRPIVTYCNGKTCLKSYEAAHKCITNGIRDVVAYDAGIMDWARAYPDQSVLLGRSPIDPRRLITRADTQKHVLSPQEFEARAGSSDGIVLDMRDVFQREATSLFFGREHQVHFNEPDKIEQFIRRAKRERKPLLIYDEVGKQVLWLQYQLEDENVAEYYFMKGGAAGYYKYLRGIYTK